jgi:alpha-methylacyl-CoA racemase
MGPLAGLRVVEFAGIGPAPFCGMLLADLGADVMLVERKVPNANTSGVSFFNLGRYALYHRGKDAVALDLKKPDGVAAALQLVGKADVLIEGFRPGVMERMGLGPDACLARNPKLVFGRMTGWGQTGPLAHVAGHDINYLALSGALSLGARPGEAPWAPPTLVGDMGGGGLLLAFGLVAAVLEARNSGKGQVVDAAIVEGAALLTTIVRSLSAAGIWSSQPGANVLDSGAPFYDTYRCADGKWISVGAIEPQFCAVLLDKCGLPPANTATQFDVAQWPDQKAALTRLFATRTRDEWCAVLEGTDACFAPVLDIAEAPDHPHSKARGSFVEQDGVVQPAPAPRFSRTQAEIRSAPAKAGTATDALRERWGFERETVSRLRDAGVLA